MAATPINTTTPAPAAAIHHLLVDDDDALISDVRTGSVTGASVIGVPTADSLVSARVPAAMDRRCWATNARWLKRRQLQPTGM